MKEFTAADRQRATIDAFFNLIEEENTRNSFINKFFKASTGVNETSYWAPSYTKDIPAIEEKKFTYYTLYKVLYFIMIAFFACYFIKIVNMMFIHPVPQRPGTFPRAIILIIVILWIFLCIKTAFSKSCIILTTTGIRLDKAQYPWSDILGTYIIKRPGESAGRKYYLALTHINGETIYYNLDFYSKIFPELSAYIEHFKKETTYRNPVLD